MSQAAYVELAQATNRDLFDEDIPLDFSDQAIHRLKRHKYPFAGALKAVDVAGLLPRADDVKYPRLRDSHRDVLTRRFDAIRIKLGDALGNLVKARRPILPSQPDGQNASLVPLISLF